MKIDEQNIFGKHRLPESLCPTSKDFSYQFQMSLGTQLNGRVSNTNFDIRLYGC
jgi:hypothetical protein